MIGRSLPADADILARPAAGLNGHGQHRLDRRIAFVELPGNDARIAVQPEGELGHIIGADRKAVEVLQELVGEDGIRRNLAHHDDPQAVDAALETIALEQCNHLLGFVHGPYEWHHDLDVGQSHLVAHFSQCPALQLKAVAKGIGDVARGTAKAQHRILLFRFVLLAAGETRILVGLEIRKAHDHRLGIKRRPQCCDTLGEFFNVESHRVGVAS